jgi:hypothetical protein
VSSVGALANGVDRAALGVWFTLKFAALARFAANVVPFAITTDTQTGAACAAVAGFAGVALLDVNTVAVGSDARFLPTFLLCRADLPFLAALPVAAGGDRTALATADHRSFTLIAAALALDADLIRVAAAIVPWSRLLVFTDRPGGRFAAYGIH